MAASWRSAPRPVWLPECCSAWCRRGRPREVRLCRRSRLTADRPREREVGSGVWSLRVKSPRPSCLLCGAGLLLRTLLVLGNYDPGYRADGDSVLTLDFSLPPPKPGTRYPTFQSLMQFYDDTTRQVGALPGVSRDRVDNRIAVWRQRTPAAAIRDRRRSAGRAGQPPVR